MQPTVRLLLALVGLAPLGTACTPKAADTCHADTDCGEAVCDFGTCRAVLCNSDADCDGRSCVSGSCTAAPEAAPEAPGIDVTCPLPASTPAPGATAVDLLTDVRVALPDAEDPLSVAIHVHAQIAAADGAGLQDAPDEVRATLIFEDSDVVVVPLSPLMPDTTYAVALTMGCGDRMFTFTTEHAEIVDAATFAPRTLQWDLTHVAAVPASASGLLGMLNANVSLVSISRDGAELGFLDSDTNLQRTCDPTMPLVGQGDNPRYAYAGNVPDVTLQNGGLSSLTLRGVARGDETDFAAVAVIDARRVAFRVDHTCVPGGDNYPGCAAAVCAYGASFGAPCGACSDGAPYCVTAEIRADSVDTDVVMTRQTLVQVCANPACSNKPICQ